MAITNACRLADFGTGIGTAGAVIDIDNTNKRVGLGTTNPNSTVTVGGMGVAGTSLFVHGDVRVVGVITADNFSGSAAGLSGLQWTNNASGIHTTKSVGIGTTTASSDYALYVQGDAYYSGNISAAGTITYEDVTNIDSLGIITGRSLSLIHI